MPTTNPLVGYKTYYIQKCWELENATAATSSFSTLLFFRQENYRPIWLYELSGYGTACSRSC